MAEPVLRPLRAAVAAVLAACLLSGAGAAPTLGAAPSPSPVPAATAEAPPDPTPEPSPGGTPAPAPTAAAPSPTEPPAPSEPPAPTPAPSSGPGPTASPGPSPTPGPTDPPAWSGTYNLYRRAAWVRQYWNYTCTAASAQTMLNLILDRSDRSSTLQQRIIRYARRHDSLRTSRGSDPQGWARALTHFGGGDYAWKRFSSRSDALRYAAARMVATGKPVGLLVWRGRHAWTMTGFASSTNPATDPDAVIAGIYVAPPLAGTDPKPNTYLRAGSLDTFARYRERDGLRAWIGYWVVVAP